MHKILPLVTSKPTGKEAGLGLSQGDDLIKAHSGLIEVKKQKKVYSLFDCQRPGE